MKRCLKLLTGVQNFKSTLNFIRTMASRAIPPSEELKLREATLRFSSCFLMVVGSDSYTEFIQWDEAVDKERTGTGASADELGYNRGQLATGVSARARLTY